MKNNSLNHRSDYRSDLGHIGLDSQKLKGFLESRKFLFLFLGASLAFFAGALVFSSNQILKLTTEYSFKQFFPKKHALLSEDKKIRKTFLLADRPSLVFVLYTETPRGWLHPEKFNWLKDRSSQIKELANVKNVFSFQSLQNAMERDSSLIIGSPFDDASPRTWPKLAQSNSLISPQLLTKNFESTLLLVEPESVQTTALESLQKSVLQTLKQPDVSVSVGGSLASQNRLSSILSHELRLFLLLSILIFCSVFCFLFSSRNALFLIIFALVFTNLFHLAWLSYFKIPLNVLLSTLPVINSISVMSLVIHTLHLWTQRPTVEAMAVRRSWEVLKELFLPNLLGTLTTSIGFLALLGAQIPIIQQYAWVIALSVFLSWILVNWIMFCAMIIFAKIKNPPQIRQWFDRPAYWGFFTLKHFKPIVFSILTLTGLALFFIPNLNFDSRLFSDLPIHDQVSRTNHWLDEYMGGTVPYEVVLLSREKQFWLSPKNLRNLSQIQRKMKRLPGVGGVYGPVDFLPYPLPKKKGQIAETLFLYSMSPEDPTRQYINPSGDRVRLSIKLKDISTDKMIILQGQIDKLISEKFPRVHVQRGGPALYAHQINQNVSKKLVFGFWESIVLIGCLLFVSFKSFRWALVACLPNAIAPLLMIAGLAMAQVPIKPSVGLIFSISLGLAFNNTVYFLSRLRSIRLSGNLSFLPLKRALSLEGNPCLFETFIMFAGFSIFLVSRFQVNQLFGVLMILSIGLGFLGDLVFLPALLRMFPGILIPPSKDRVEDLQYPRVSRWGRAAGWITILFGLLMAPKIEAAALSAKDILNKTRLKVETRDESAKVQLVIIESNGDKKVRELFLKSRRKSGQASTIARISRPADVKGMGLLSQIENGTESHWIFLPQSKQVRRVVGSQTQSGVLGSELSAGDMNSEILRGAKAKLVGVNKTSYQIQVNPRKSKAQFTHAILTISKQFLPQKIEYYNGKKPRKTVEFKDYAHFGSIWRPKSLTIRNHLNHRGTDLTLSSLQINKGLKDFEFSQAALKEDMVY